MKRTFELEDLDCANCAAKIEAAIAKLDGVEAVSVNYIMQKMTIETSDDEFDAVMKKTVKLCRRIEPDMRIKL